MQAARADRRDLCALQLKAREAKELAELVPGGLNADKRLRIALELHGEEPEAE